MEDYVLIQIMDILKTFYGDNFNKVLLGLCLTIIAGQMPIIAVLYSFVKKEMNIKETIIGILVSILFILIFCLIMLAPFGYA